MSEKSEHEHTPARTSWPDAPGAPPVLRQRENGVNSPNSAGGEIPPERFRGERDLER
jgi:hypothetical protein